jgi:hypothetical protein
MATKSKRKSPAKLQRYLTLNEEAKAAEAAFKAGYYKKQRITAPAIEPGSYSEYLWKHPEEADRILREHGVDVEEVNRILERGGGVLPIGYVNKKNQPIEKKT